MLDSHFNDDSNNTVFSGGGADFRRVSDLRTPIQLCSVVSGRAFGSMLGGEANYFGPPKLRVKCSGETIYNHNVRWCPVVSSGDELIVFAPRACGKQFTDHDVRWCYLSP